LGGNRWPVERSNAWVPEEQALGAALPPSDSLCGPCSRPPAYSWSQAASPASSDNRLLINALPIHVSWRAVATDHDNITVAGRYTAANVRRSSPNHLGVMSNILPLVGTGHIGKYALNEISFFVAPHID
jgi:hypothetical protein